MPFFSLAVHLVLFPSALSLRVLVYALREKKQP